MSVRVLVFDFDGVLSIPWTYPELPFPEVPLALKKLHEAGFKLCVASYNSNAQIAINQWGLQHLFTAIRARSNKVWEQHDKKNYNNDIHGDGVGSQNLDRFEISKAMNLETHFPIRNFYLLMMKKISTKLIVNYQMSKHIISLITMQDSL